MIDFTGGRTLASLTDAWGTARGPHDFLAYLPDDGAPVHRVTWQDFAERLHVLRSRLAQAGAVEQERVLIALPNAPAFHYFWLATSANGAVAQSADPDAGELVFARLLAMTDPRVVVGHAGNAARLRQVVGDRRDCRLVVVPDLLLRDPRDEDLALPPAVAAAPPTADSPDLVAGLIQTSGTSGSPKLVELTHRNYVYAGECLARNIGYRQDDRSYVSLPLFHTGGQLFSSMAAVVSGASIGYGPRFSASRYFEWAKATESTVGILVAPPMRMIMQRAAERGMEPVDTGTMRLVLYGQNIGFDEWAIWDRLFPRVVTKQVYGQTESVSGVIGTPVWETDDRVHLGAPFFGVEGVRVVGPDGLDVPTGEQGELWVRGRPGRTLMRGYYNDSAATGRTIVEGRWLRTGDYVVRDEVGRFRFVGRAMHIIRRGGENVSVHELEVMMRDCPMVEDVAVRPEPDEVLDWRVSVFVIPRPDFEEQAFRTWCLAQLGKRGAPDDVIVKDEFPRTPTGRVILRDL